MADQRHLTAKEAAEALGVSRATLYAYVSRGMIRSEAGDDDSRQRRYNGADIDRLLQRKQARRDPDNMAEGTLDWGLPILESAIVLIQDGDLYYRGLNAERLARESSLEAVAGLVWHGSLDACKDFSPDNRVSAAAHDVAPSSADDMTRLLAVLALVGSDDYGAYDLRPAGIARTGARILRLIVDLLAGEHAGDGRLAETLAAAWSPGEAAALDAALILSADHELNASSFTARVVAGAGASPYGVVTAGLAALAGVRHGGESRRVTVFLHEVKRAGDPSVVIAERLERGERVPGFGHRLYPEGDPRGRALLELAASRGDVTLITDTAAAVSSITQEKPTLDFGLGALAHALSLPDDAPLLLFALGRTVGWIGHAIEQSTDSTMIRPRARYTGPMPDSE